MVREFQERVIQELKEQDCPAGRAARAQLAAIMQCCGTHGTAEDGTEILQIRTGRHQVREKCFTLFEKTINITGVSACGEGAARGQAGDVPSGTDTCGLTGEPVRQIAAGLSFLYDGEGAPWPGRVVPSQLLSDRRCVRSFLAGEFLCVGSVRDPQREYYLSFDIVSEGQAQQTIDLLASQGIPLRIVSHGRHRAVVTRDSDVIVDVLNLLGAHVSMMEMENARIMKQVRGGINRKVNCETANIIKTVTASQKQLEDIRLIRGSSAWEDLPDSLRQMALLREQYPDSSLQELGEMLDPPIGKSGVNHRLRRLSELARGLQDGDDNRTRSTCN